MNRSKRVLSFPFETLSVLFASVFLFGSTVSAQSLIEVRPLSHNEQVISERSHQVEQKSTILKNTSNEIQTLEQKKQSLSEQLTNENNLIEELKQKIADKKAAEARATEAARAVPAPAYTASAPSGQGPMSGCGDNQYAAYIYGQESGGKVTGNCNPGSINPGGCRGIGQACPGGKLPCGADYACQNAYFTNYALGRYGSWAAAYNFHIGHGWW